MGSWRVVAAVGALAAVAWAAVIVGAWSVPARPDTVERAFDGLRADEVTRLSVGVGASAMHLQRVDGRFVSEAGRPADPDVMQALLGALEFTFARRRRARGVERPQATLVVGLAGGTERRLELGERVADGALVWVGVKEGARLVTAAESEQLFVAVEELLDRRVFRDVGSDLESLSVESNGRSIRAEGQPLMVRVSGASAAPKTGGLRVDRRALTALLVELEAIELSDGAASGPASGLAIRVSTARGEARLEDRGRCGDNQRAVSTHLGDGCVPKDALGIVEGLVAGPRPLAALGPVDPNRAPTRAVAVLGPTRIAIDPRQGGGAAAAHWIAALGDAVDVLETKASPRAVVTLHYDRGDPDTIELGADADGAWAGRLGSDVRWRLRDPRVAAINAVTFRSRQLLDRDRLELRELTLRRRGRAAAVFRRDDAGVFAPALPGSRADELLSHLEAVRFVSATVEAGHGLARPRAVLELRFDPAPVATDAPDAVDVRIGSAATNGCHAQLAGDPAVFIAVPPVCALAEE